MTDIKKAIFGNPPFRLHWALCLTAYLLCPSTIPQAQTSSFHLSAPMDSVVDLRHCAYIFADTNRTLDWKSADELLSKGQFKPLNEFEWAGKFTRGKYAYWLVIDVSTEGADVAQKLIFNPTKKDTLHIWQLFENSPIAYELVGNHVPNPNVRQRLPFPVKADVPLTFEPNKKYRLLVRMVSELAVHTDLSPKLYAPAYRSRTLGDELPGFLVAHGVFFGILFFMALYSLIQFFQNREWAFLWYACYLLVVLLFYLREFNGWNDVFLIFPGWFAKHHYYLPMAFGLYFFYFLFANSFLNAKEKIPKLYLYSRRLVIGMLVFFLMERILLFIDPWWSWRFITAARVVFIFIGIYFILLLVKNPGKLMFFILTGTVLLLLSNLATIFLSFGDDHSIGLWDYTHIPSYIGVLLEILLFSTGLGY